MKKLATLLMIGVLALPVAISTVAYAQDAPASSTTKTKKAKKAKKGKKAKTDSTSTAAPSK